MLVFSEDSADSDRGGHATSESVAVVRGVLQGGEIPPLDKIYKRIDEIAPVYNQQPYSEQSSLSDDEAYKEREEDEMVHET